MTSFEEDTGDQLPVETSGTSTKDETRKEGKEDISRKLWKLRINRTSILKVKGRVWFLWLCLALDLVPKTLSVKLKDPKASDKSNYSDEMKEEWDGVKKEVGRKLVKVAKQREEKLIRSKEVKWWEEARQLSVMRSGRKYILR